MAEPKGGLGAVTGAVPAWALLVPFMPIVGMVICGLCAIFGVRNKLPAFATVACLAVSFIAAAGLLFEVTGGINGGKGMTAVVHAWDWIQYSFSQPGTSSAKVLVANFSFYIDTLTVLWMLFVAGLATVIALYASEYMSHDVGLGYCRFFAAFNLFVFSMACLVMGDNLFLLFLGWEGVGLCSYLLIGYFYKKPAAVAASKKAFIMNRIGDLGLSLGIMLTFVHFGTIEYAKLFPMVEEYLKLAQTGQGDKVPEVVRWIALLLTVGAFGKSAQIFFYVWLPDAMEGPTPVSALIHAATMVTAGVFLIARMYPIFLADPELIALSVVAWCGAITAIWAATIEMAIFDIKRVMGYSTISQLGFMFAGLGLLTPVGAAFHTFTHAFFKATLFLGVGAVMHGFGGQLDLRRLSGVMWMKGFGLVGIAMLIGSINLSGVPFTAGYFSKDIILAEAFARPHGQIIGSQWVAWILLLTAGMTAYYTFRTFLRVYVGPKEFSPGDDAELIDMGRHPKGTTLEQWHAEHGHGHGHGDGHGDGHGHGHGHGDGHGHGHGPEKGHPAHGSVAELRTAHRLDFDPTTEEFDPHPPSFAMKLAIGLCAAMTIVVAGLYFVRGLPGQDAGGWVGGMIHHSTAAFDAGHGAGHAADHAGHAAHAAHGTFLGMDPHKVMYYVSAGVGLVGILLAMFLHGPKGIWSLFIGNRVSAGVAPRADAIASGFGPLTRAARNKYYVDEIYDAVIVKPLLVLSHVFHLIDKLIVDGLVNLVGAVPKWLGGIVRRQQTGHLHDYAMRMAAGVTVITLIVLAVRAAGGWR
jgi:NADH-quinone oxidoreductase subunit L